MRNILFILAAMVGFGAFAQTNIPTRIMLADSNGVVKMPTNITRIRIGGTDYTNLLGFGLSITNGQLSVDTTQLPSGGGSGVVTSVTDDFEIDGGELALTNALGTGPLVRQSAASGVGTVTSVGASTTVSGLGFSGTPVTGSGTFSLTGVVAVASGGTGGTDASTARSNLGVLSSRWLTGFGSPSDYSEGIGTYYVNLDTYQVWEQTGVSTFETIPFFVMGEGVYSYLDQPNTFANTNTFAGPVVLLSGISGNGTLLTNLNGTEIRSGTVAEARIDSTIARLSSPTFTGDPKVPTASPGDNDTSAASTAFVTAAVTAGDGGGDVTQSGNNTFTGTNTFSGTTTFNDLAIVTITVVSNLIVPNNAYGAGWNGSTDVPNENSVYDEMELRAPKASPVFTGSATFTSLSASLINSRPYYNQDNGDFWADGFNRSSAANAFLPNLSGSAVASGSVSGVLISTNNPVAWTLASSTTTNSGYFYWNGHASTFDISGGGDELTFILAISNTNKIQGAWGFIDDFTHTESVDGAYIRMDNGFIHGVIANNSSYTRTATSNQLAIASTTFRRYVIRVAEDASYVTFFDLSPSGTGYTTNWTASVTNTLPSGSTRATSIGVVAINRDTPSAINLLSLDAVGKRNNRILPR